MSACRHISSISLLTITYRFCLNIGWLYTRLVAFNSGENSGPTPNIGQIEGSEPTEVTNLLTRTANSHLNQSIVEFMAM